MNIALFAQINGKWRFEGIVTPGVGAHESMDAKQTLDEFVAHVEADNGADTALAIQLPARGTQVLVPIDMEMGSTLAGE